MNEWTKKKNKKSKRKWTCPIYHILLLCSSFVIIFFFLLSFVSLLYRKSKSGLLMTRHFVEFLLLFLLLFYFFFLIWKATIFIFTSSTLPFSTKSEKKIFILFLLYTTVYEHKDVLLFDQYIGIYVTIGTVRLLSNRMEIELMKMEYATLVIG